MDLPFFTATPRRWHKRKQPPGAESPTLTLTAATYDPDYSSVTLTFNTDINTDAMDPAAISVNDPEFQGSLLTGMTTTGQTANSVTIEMEIAGSSSGTGVKLTVMAGNGIVSVTDGSEWEGVTGLALPFG